MRDWPFSWRKPESVYDTDGPELERDQLHEEVIAGISFTLRRTGSGAHTGRDRFRVVCLACGEELHRSTTGPSSRISYHLTEKHSSKGPPPKSPEKI